MSERFIPKEESEFAKDFLSKLKNQDIEYAKSKIDSDLLSQVTDEQLMSIASRFRSGDLISVKIIGSEVSTSNGIWIGNFTFEYEFSDGWNIAYAALQRVDVGYEVVGLNVHTTDQSLREVNAFNLSSKSFLQYTVLFMAVTFTVFIIITLIVCIKTPIPKRKWLWVIFILFGVGSIQIDWTTGLYAFQIFNFNFLGASAVKAGPAAPWVISASLPLGAIIFWFKHRDLISQSSLANKAFTADV